MSNTTSTPWFAVSMALVGIIFGYGIATGTGGASPAAAPSAPTAAAPSAPSAPAPAPSAKDVVPVDAKEDHIFGDVNAAITVIEYSDYECPFCARHHPTLAQLVEDNDDVNWVYRHFPLGFHSNATPLAEASECITELGGNDAFWAFTDSIFAEGADAANIEKYANDAGVDGAAVRKCVDDGKYAQNIKDEMAGGSAGGVSGTPGNIVINNKTGDTRLVSGAQPVSAFQAAVDALR
jgi:protein-disulfide isomerase